MFTSRGQKLALMSRLSTMVDKSNGVDAGSRCRRSRRITPLKEAEYYVSNCIDKKCLEKRYINEDIGFGVFTTEAISSGDFVLEYAGKLLSVEEADEIQDQTYIYYFQISDLQYSIDATDGTRLGKYVNDATKRHANCVTKPVFLHGLPRVLLFALKDIPPNTELRYDYGGKELPWRRKGTTSALEFSVPHVVVNDSSAVVTTDSGIVNEAGDVINKASSSVLDGGETLITPAAGPGVPHVVVNSGSAEVTTDDEKVNEGGEKGNCNSNKANSLVIDGGETLIAQDAGLSVPHVVVNNGSAVVTTDSGILTEAGEVSNCSSNKACSQVTDGGETLSTQNAGFHVPHVVVNNGSAVVATDNGIVDEADDVNNKASSQVIDGGETLITQNAGLSVPHVVVNNSSPVVTTDDGIVTEAGEVSNCGSNKTCSQVIDGGETLSTQNAGVHVPHVVVNNSSAEVTTDNGIVDEAGDVSNKASSQVIDGGETLITQNAGLSVPHVVVNNSSAEVTTDDEKVNEGDEKGNCSSNKASSHVIDGGETLITQDAGLSVPHVIVNNSSPVVTTDDGIVTEAGEVSNCGSNKTCSQVIDGGETLSTQNAGVHVPHVVVNNSSAEVTTDNGIVDEAGDVSNKASSQVIDGGETLITQNAGLSVPHVVVNNSSAEVTTDDEKVNEGDEKGNCSSNKASSHVIDGGETLITQDAGLSVPHVIVNNSSPVVTTDDGIVTEAGEVSNCGSNKTCSQVIDGGETLITPAAGFGVTHVVVKGSSAEETTDNGMFKAGKLQKVSYIVQAKRKLVDVRYCENDETIDDSDVDPDYVPGSDESESDNSTWDSAVDAFVSDRKRPKIASSGLGESSVSIRPATTSKQSNKHVLSHHVDSLKPMNVVSKKVSSIRQDCEPGASLTETSKQTVDPEEEADASLDDSSVMLHTEDSINEEVSADKRQRTDRPARPCPFCGQFKVRLTRHLRTVHKKESAVSNCLMQDLSEQRAVYKQLKRSGIMAYNMKVAGQKDINLQRERTCKTQSKAVVCDCCSGVFNRRWFAAHKQKCDAKQGVEPRPINASVVFSSLNVPEEFKTDVLSKFSSDEVGRLCQQDETIIMIGHKLYLKVKARKDKKVQVRRSVMTDMRRLGHLYIHFQTIDQRNANQSAGDCSMSVLDMFRRQNFNVLEEACASYTAADESSGGKNKPDKSGLQLALYYLLIKAAKILKVFYLVKNDNLKSSETAEFLDVLHFSKDSLIGGAIYNTNKNRNTKLRRVDNLPQLEDLSNLKTHMVSRMQQILNDEFLLWTSSIFVEVRDLACARLTLFNARRGGEPARLQVSDWSDACSQVWFDKTRMQAMPPEEKELIEKSYVMYQTGKGVNHLVPVIVPDDTVPALRKLTDATIRSECGVNPENSYLFPSTVASESNVSGWHALKRACIQSGVSSSRITATKMRHLASTMYASLDVPEAKRAAFYSHMGHSKAVNAAIYQTPLAEQEVLEVGAILHRFDNVTNAPTCSQPSNTSTGSSQSNVDADNIDNTTVAGDVRCSGQEGAEREVSVIDCLDNAANTATADSGVGNVQKEGIRNVSASKAGKPKPARGFTRWTKNQTKMVTEYFAAWIENTDRKGLPGKADILPFLTSHDEITHEWTIVRNKVLNEKMAFAKRRKVVLEDLE